MPFEFEDLNCNIFGDFKVGDNAVYNASLLCDLIEANENGKLNKSIILQAASMIEVATIQIFYRARNYNREGVPRISEEDRQEIAEKSIDKLAVIIDNLKKYGILDGLAAGTYEELHQLRKYRNKIHIYINVNVPGASRDEGKLFTAFRVRWAVDLCWRVHLHLADHFPRPEHIDGNVQPLRLPRVV